MNISQSPAADLFQIPHSRMKELVEAHLTKVREIKSFSVAPEDLLQAVYEAMWELKSHEYIENHFIMDRLKERLQAKRVCAAVNVGGVAPRAVSYRVVYRIQSF